MARKTYLVEKLKPGRKVLPCKDPDCDIRTNKRYRSPEGTTYVACCYDHGDKAYRLDLVRQRKTLAVAAA